ncbi:MAG TPA: iron-containing alcohol dehydrogenase [Vicinamibacterales bacterium]|nr:iron-containing alcohol dehydrogenase [Vicinamibacterales bacterium]
MSVRVVFGPGALDQVGTLARQLAFTRALIVADKGIVQAGFVERAARLLRAAGVEPAFFHAFDANPDTDMVEAGRVAAAAAHVDGIVALGGGSSLDCAKGINFVLTNGGSMRDYRGHGKAAKPMLPSIGIPTTAGTGSEAQSYALISDAETHAKMACGDEKAAFRIAILDPALTVSQPREVTAVAGYDAISHAVEAFVTKTRTPESARLAAEAWTLLDSHFERVLRDPADLEARGAMLRGANLAGAAIELSMLGAAHACANPLTARYGTTHGIAVAVMLPHVVRWNGEVVGARYRELCADDLPGRLEALRSAAGLPATLRELGARAEDVDALAADAATQWTGTHNPRPFSADDARALYRAAGGVRV